jgi:hypothetical protein
MRRRSGVPSSRSCRTQRALRRRVARQVETTGTCHVARAPTTTAQHRPPREPPLPAPVLVEAQDVRGRMLWVLEYYFEAHLLVGPQ